MVYSFINQKGGVGKTTSAINIASYMASFGYKVLLLDLDSQANASNALGVNTTKNTTYHLLTDRADIVRDSMAHNTCIDGLSIIPSCRYMAGVEIELSTVEKGRENILRSKLSAVIGEYDYIIIDCPPALGTVTVNALVASDAIIIPMQCEYLSMLGLSQLMYTIRQTKKYLNPRLQIAGIILTMYDKRSRLTLEVEHEIEEYFEGKVYDARIPRNIRLAECPSFGLPILKYAEDSKGAIAYKALSEEIIERERGENNSSERVS